MKPNAFLALVLGITLGTFGASFALAPHLSPRQLLTTLMEEDATEPDVAEHDALHEEVKIVPDESTTTLSHHEFISLDASKTSSSRSVKIPVIIYHSVRPYMKGESKYQDLYDVTPSLLEQELTYIETHGFHAVDMRDVDAYFRGATTSLPENPVMLTFDDGWKNQYKYAFPLLQKYHMKAVFFIFTNPIDHKKPHWMSWKNILELDRAGMEIGGHTRTHPILTKISSDSKKLDHEILEPKQIIERRLGHAISSFAYPFGAKNQAVEVAVARAGYSIARTTISGVWNDPEHRLEFHGTLSSDHLKDFIHLLEKP